MENFVLPDYQGKSLLNAISTILQHFGVKPHHPALPNEFSENMDQSEKVIFFLMDGYGDNLYQKIGLKYPFFKKLAQKGIYSKITTVFPSTTTAAVTATLSGLSPIEHGLYEWWTYFSENDLLLSPLPFLPMLAEDMDKTVTFDPKILFNHKTIFEMLQEVKVPSFTFTKKNLAQTVYNKQASKGTILVPYVTPADLMVSLRQMLKNVSGKAFFYIYISPIDTAEHGFGVWTPEVEAEISVLSYLFETEFVQKIEKKDAENVILLMSADHGQITTDPKETIYLDEIAGFDASLEISVQGRPILPAGGARDVFLHIKEDRRDELKKVLQQKLKDKAEILFMEEAIEKGLFGKGKMHDSFLQRAGNMLVLAKGDSTIWYHHTPRETYDLLGMHGGLSADEMEIPFVCTKLSDLI